MSTTKKYISVDAANDTTNDTIKMQNPDNEVTCAKLETTDPYDNTIKDATDIFFSKKDFDGLDVVTIDDPGFTLEELG